MSFWVDDGDAVTEAGELQPLSKYGITQIVLPLAKETLASHANREVEREVNVFGGKFNEDFYRATYSDVDTAVRGGQFPTGYAHFIEHGITEGRNGMWTGASGEFDEASYLAAIWILPKWLQMVNIVVEHHFWGWS